MIRQKIDEYKSDIEIRQHLIKDLQDNVCEHKITELGVVWQSAGHFPTECKFCKDCDKVLYELSLEDINWIRANCFPFNRTIQDCGWTLYSGIGINPMYLHGH